MKMKEMKETNGKVKSECDIKLIVIVCRSFPHSHVHISLSFSYIIHTTCTYKKNSIQSNVHSSERTSTCDSYPKYIYALRIDQKKYSPIVHSHITLDCYLIPHSFSIIAQFMCLSISIKNSCIPSLALPIYIYKHKQTTHMNMYAYRQKNSHDESREKKTTDKKEEIKTFSN